MTIAHRFRHFSTLAATLACALVALGTLPALAQAAPVAAPATGGHVTVLVLDMSGSMAQNDPNGLRCSAANAYIDLSAAGDFVGVIDLTNASGARGGNHNFQKAGSVSNPVEMATVADRQALKQTIATATHNCAPSGNTPTYDALAQAYGMLSSATQGGHVPGSVVLLTDGVPFPDTNQQVAAIQSDLVPQFKARGWPIDTIALGADSSFHGFLSDISNATAGKFYDDGKGPVKGVSPLNLAAFFVDIFSIRNGRTPGQTIAPITLNGGTTQRNFTVGGFVAHLDVIAVKDQPGTTVTLTAPGGQTIAAATPGAFVATDPHYVIFSIDTPQPGIWTINVTGGGQFLMDSLVVSTLALTLARPAQGATLPLGQPVTLAANLVDTAHGNAGVGQYAVTAVVSYAGGGPTNAVEAQLSDQGGTGNYAGAVTIPTSDPAGSYQIAVSASAVSQTAAAVTIVAQFTLFPTPVLISPVTLAPVSNAVTHPVAVRVVTWDPVLQFVYSLPGFGSDLVGWHPADWPLQGLAARPQALVNGEVLVGATPYSDATVTATGTNITSGAVVPIDVESDGQNFRLFWPVGAHGTFAVTLVAHGRFHDTYGALVTSSARVVVTIGLPSLLDELRAWAITLLYLLVLAFVTVFFIYGPVNYTVRAKPNGRSRLIDLAINRSARMRGDLDPGLPIAWHGWSLRRYFAPNVVPAGEVSLPDNLRFVFRRGNEVAIRVRQPRGKGGAPVWRIDGRPITPADGAETLVSNMRVSMSEAGQTTEWTFEQDVRRVEDVGSPASAVANRIADVASGTPLGDRLRRGRSTRRD